MPATKPRAYQVYDIDWKQAVRALSDSNINLASPGALVIDTVVLDPYDRVLLTAQTNATENGIYQVNAAQTLLVPAPDWININSGLSSAVNSGLTVSVTDGAEYAQTTWTLTTPNPVIIGTTPINFARTPDQISNVAIDGTTIELANNASETSISIKPSGTAGLVGITVPDDATADVANLHIYNLVANGNVKVSTAGGDWLYDTEGDFTGAGNVTAGYFQGNGAFLTGISALGSFIANGTSTVDIGTVDGNVVVTTDGANAWTFDTAGNLTMPGSLVAETAGNTGSLRWEINGSNLNVLKLIPDDNLVPEDRYVVIDPYNTGHIHIRAGGIQDASNSYLYLGGEDVHVEVDDVTKEIRVKTYDVVGVSAYQFSFRNDGHFQSPNGIITGGNLSVSGNAQAQYFIGNGALLTGISAGSSYSNANAAAYAELGWAGNIIPNANAVYSLGNVTNQWGNLWVANNTIYLGNVPLAIGAGNVLTVDGNAVLQNNSNSTISTTGNITAGNVNTGKITLTNGAMIRDTAGDAVAIGQQAGETSQGNYAVAMGFQAAITSQGIGAVAIGREAGNAQGAYAVAIGQEAGFSGQSSGAIAIGLEAGETDQGGDSVAIGYRAGGENQDIYAVAIGYQAGNNTQGGSAVAIGEMAGTDTQGVSAVAVGDGAGRITQGEYAVALGRAAGDTNQGNNSIIINATGSALDQTTANTFTVAPIRNDVANVAAILFYNTTSKEITYGNVISVAGNITGGNLSVSGNVSGQYFIGNGAFLTGISAGSSYSNANVANYLPTYVGNLGAGNINFVNGSTIKTAVNNVNMNANTGGAVEITTDGGNYTWSYDNYGWMYLPQAQAAYTPVVNGSVLFGSEALVFKAGYANLIFDNTGNTTTANYFLGNIQGLVGNITNLDSLNFAVENISALVANNGVNIGAGGFNNLVVLPTDVLIQNVPLSVAANIVGVTADNDGRIEWMGNSSGDGGGYTTLTLTPDTTVNGQVLVLDPTAPGHIHLRAPGIGGNVEQPTANIFLGPENTNFEITAQYGNAPQARIHSAGNTWTFGNDGNLALPGNTSNINYANGINILDGYATVSSQYFSNATSLSYNDFVTGNYYNASTLELDYTAYTGASQLALYVDYQAPLTANIGISVGAVNAPLIQANANIVLTANSGTAQTWTFGTDGNLTLPANMIVSGNVNFLGTDTALLNPADNTPLSLFTSGTSGTVTSFWAQDVGNLMSSNIAAFYLPLQGTQTVRIVNGTNGGNIAIYDFDKDGVFSTTEVSATGNVSADYLVVSGGIRATGASPAPTLSGFSSISTVSASGNITASGNLIANVGITTVGNVTGNYFIGNGSQLTGLSANYGNANVADYLPTYTGNIAGNIVKSGYTWTFSNTGTTTFPTGVTLSNARGPNTVNFLTGVDKSFQIETQTNVTSKLWNFTTDGNLTLPQNGNINFSNGVNILSNLAGTYGNSNVANFLAAYGSNTIVTTGNITAGNLIGNISITGNVTGTSANVTLVAGSYNWTFNNTGNLVLPANTFAVNYANGTAVQLGGAGNYGNANVVANLAALGINPISTTSNITAGNLIANDGINTVGNVSAGNIAVAGIVTFADATYQTTAWTGLANNYIALGTGAGGATQSQTAVAIGVNAGNVSQDYYTVAIGIGAGRDTQLAGAIAIGGEAGGNSQGTNAIAIGYRAGRVNQANNSIVLNSTGANLNANTANTLTIAPIRNTSGTDGVLQYNNTTKEVSYGSTLGGNLSVTGNITADGIGTNLIRRASFIGTANTAVTLDNFQARLGGSPVRLYINTVSGNATLTGTSQTYYSGGVNSSQWVNVPVGAGAANAFAMSGAVSPSTGGEMVMLNFCDQISGTFMYRVTAIVANTTSGNNAVTIERLA